MIFDRTEEKLDRMALVPSSFGVAMKTHSLYQGAPKCLFKITS